MTNWPFIDRGGTTHIERTEGCYLYTDDGREILDACGGAIVTNIGHGRQEVTEVVAKATQNSGYVVPPWLTPEREALVNALTANWLPDDMDRMHLTCGGSEGNETAMKMAILYQAARGNPEKYKIIGRDVSYHGTTLATTAVGGHELRKAGLHHVLAEHPVAPTPYTLRCESSDPVRYFADAFKQVLDDEDPATVAGLLLEPITGASGGAIVPPDGYLEEIYGLCREHNILVISDEVMTGFGRTGARFGYQHWDVEPDVIVGGKGLAGGYAPLTGVFASSEIAETIGEAGYQLMFHTFAAHPAACAAATKVLEIIEREDLVNRARDMGELFSKRLQGAFSNHPHVAECRGRGLLQAIELVQDRDTLELYDANDNIAGRVVNTMFENGVSVYKAGNGPIQDVILMGPPLIVEAAEIDKLVEIASEAIDAVTLN